MYNTQACTSSSFPPHIPRLTLWKQNRKEWKTERYLHSLPRVFHAIGTVIYLALALIMLQQ